jgi:multiple sugar transport system substrate-binding protein
MKEAFLKLFILCGLSFTIESCEKQIEIKILGEDSSNLKSLESLKDSYEKESSINLSFRPNSFEDAQEKANQDFINETGLYDIVLQYNFSLSSYVRKHYIWELDSLLKKADKQDFDFEKDLFEDAWKEVGFYYKNPKDPDVNQLQKVGYPFAINTMLLVYNKKMFEDGENKKKFKKKYGKELTVPADWESYKQIAEFFTTPNTFGVCMQGAPGSWLYYEYCDFLYGNGGSIFEKKYGWEDGEDTKITINSPEAVSATEFYLSMSPYNKGNYDKVDANEQVKMILEGNVAMGFVWSDYLSRFLSEDVKKSQFGFAPLPGNISPIAGGCFYVNKKTKYPREAINFIMYIMKPEVQVELALKGLCSPFKSTYENPIVKERIPYAQALSESLERGRYMYEAGREASLVSDIITNHLQRLWHNRKLKVSDVLQQIAFDIEAQRSDLYNNESN